MPQCLWYQVVRHVLQVVLNVSRVQRLIVTKQLQVSRVVLEVRLQSGRVQHLLFDFLEARFSNRNFRNGSSGVLRKFDTEVVVQRVGESRGT